MSHRTSRRTVIAGAVSAFTVGGARAEDEPVFAHIFGVDHPLHVWATWAATEAARKSEGRISFRVVAGGGAGREAELQRGLDDGTIAFTYSGFGQLGSRYQPMSLMGAAYVFDDLAHWRAVTASPLFGELVVNHEKVGGHHVIAPLYYGERHLTTRFRVVGPDDVRGLRVRVPLGSPLIQILFPVLGARAVVSPYGEIVETLRSGLVDAQENPLPTVLSLGIHELTPFINMTGHIVDGQAIMASRSWWRRAAVEDRDLLSEVFAAAAEGASRDIARAERDIALNLVYSGSVINAVNREPFRNRFRNFYRVNPMPWSLELFDRVLETR